MCPRSRYRWLALVTAAAWFLFSSFGRADGSWQRLFVIERSKNANIVVYDLHTNQRGEIDIDRPLAAYWILRTEGGKREGLSWLERQLAFGYKLLGKPRPQGLRFHLVSLSSRVIEVRRAGPRFSAQTPISGRPCWLRSIYVATREDGVMPRVEYIDLRGNDIETGRAMLEHVVNRD